MLKRAFPCIEEGVSLFYKCAFLCFISLFTLFRWKCFHVFEKIFLASFLPSFHVFIIASFPLVMLFSCIKYCLFLAYSFAFSFQNDTLFSSKTPLFVCRNTHLLLFPDHRFFSCFPTSFVLIGLFVLPY